MRRVFRQHNIKNSETSTHKKKTTNMKPDSKIHHIDNIHVDIPYTWILQRLGYDKDDHPDEHTLKIIEESMIVALSDCKCSGAFRILKVESLANNQVLLENNIHIKSAHIAKFLFGCQYAALIFATAGETIVNEIEADIHNSRITEALILDAAGSEIADLALEQVQNAVTTFVKKFGLQLKNARFSPGYGDFSLSNQKIFFKTLDMADHALTLSKTFQICPEKSVTAICGLQ